LQKYGAAQECSRQATSDLESFPGRGEVRSLLTPAAVVPFGFAELLHPS
jgi:hypothetical protein